MAVRVEVAGCDRRGQLQKISKASVYKIIVINAGDYSLDSYRIISLVTTKNPSLPLFSENVGKPAKVIIYCTIKLPV